MSNISIAKRYFAEAKAGVILEEDCQRPVLARHAVKNSEISIKLFNYSEDDVMIESCPAKAICNSIH